MTRDGAREAIWQGDVQPYQTTSKLDSAAIYDALIVGGGITGLTTALMLQQKGLKCILAEAHTICFGTTGGTTAHLNTVMDTPYYEIENKFGAQAAKLVAEGAREAIAAIELLCLKHHMDADFAYKPGFLFAQNEDEDKELVKIAEGSMRQGIEVATAPDLPVTIPFTSAFKVERQAVVHPTKYIHGLAEAFEKAGGVLLQNCRVNAITGDDTLAADTELGTISAKNAVYATHLPPGINIFSLKCAPYRSYAIAFTLRTGDYPEALVYDIKNPYHYYRTHEVDGKKYLIAGGNDHKTGHRENTAYIFTELEAYVRRYFDIDEVAYRWSSQYYDSVDGLPYIGKMPGHENMFVATGFIGNGMVYGTLSALLITDLITQGASPYADVFDPGRIKIFAGFSKMVKENADVVSQFIGQYLHHNSLKEIADVAPGDAVVAEWEGKKVAIYKDEAGKVTLLDPICPHAKCTVKWNSAEKSWDCPCHGARYAPDGELLCGPAPKGLAKITLSEEATPKL